MKRTLYLLIALVLALNSPAVAQRKGTNLKNETSIAKALIPLTRANTAATGPWISMLGYDAAIVSAQSGLMDAATQYLVLQDSTVGSAVALVDSVNVAADSTTTFMAYNGTGRFIRVVLRASGANGDSSWVASIAVRGHCRTLPCP